MAQESTTTQLRERAADSLRWAQTLTGALLVAGVIGGAVAGSLTENAFIGVGVAVGSLAWWWPIHAVLGYLRWRVAVADELATPPPG